MYPEQSGGDLVRLRNGGERALAEVFAHHRPLLRQMVRRRMDRRLARRVDASDVLQEGFVDAARRLDGYLQQPTMPPLVWLRLVLTRRIIALYRRHFRVQKRDVRKEESCPSLALGGPRQLPPAQMSARVGTPSEIVSLAEQRGQLEQAIGELEPLDREIIHLRHIHQLTNGEIARQLGLSPSAASKRYVRAVARLRGRT